MICQSFNCGRPAKGAFCEECVTTMTVPENSQMSETLPASPATAPTNRESVVAGCNTSLSGGEITEEAILTVAEKVARRMKG